MPFAVAVYCDAALRRTLDRPGKITVCSRLSEALHQQQKGGDLLHAHLRGRCLQGSHRFVEPLEFHHALALRRCDRARRHAAFRGEMIERGEDLAQAEADGDGAAGKQCRQQFIVEVWRQGWILCQVEPVDDHSGRGGEVEARDVEVDRDILRHQPCCPLRHEFLRHTDARKGEFLPKAPLGDEAVDVHRHGQLPHAEASGDAVEVDLLHRALARYPPEDRQRCAQFVLEFRLTGYCRLLRIMRDCPGNEVIHRLHPEAAVGDGLRTLG